MEKLYYQKECRGLRGRSMQGLEEIG